MSPCCNASRPIFVPAAMRSNSLKNSGDCRSRRNRSTRSCAARSCSSRTTSPAAHSVSLRWSGRNCSEVFALHWAPALNKTSTSISRRATGRGDNALHLCPNADLFKAISSGKASVVTDEIDRFTNDGILLKSGETLKADIIVTATGFNLNVLGDIAFEDRRQAAGFRRNRHLSRHDVHGHPEHGLGVRLFPRQLDAAHRSGRRTSSAACSAI